MRAAVLGLFLAVTAPAVATAAPVTVVMGGSWDLVLDDGNLLSGVDAGDAFTLTFTYDDAAPVTNASPGAATYGIDTVPLSIALSTGAYTFSYVSGGFAEIGIYTSPPPDEVTLYAEDFVGGPGLPAIDFAYTNPLLSDASGTALPSTALTTVPWNLALFDSASMSFYAGFSGGDELVLEGTIEELVVVPEPSSMALIATGLVGLAGAVRRRR